MELKLKEKSEQIIRENLKLKEEIDTLRKDRSQFNQMKLIFDSLPSIVYIVDPQSYKILYANKKLKDSFNDDLEDRICYKILQNKDAPCDFCTNKIILKNPGVPYEWEYHNPIIGRDFLVFDQTIKWYDGRLVRFESALDITEKNCYYKDKLSLLNKIESEKKRYETLIENIPLKVFHKDKNSIYLACNQNYADDLLIDKKDIIGKTDYDFYPKEFAEKYRNDDKFVVETGETIDIVEKIKIKNEISWIETKKTPVFNNDGEITGVLGLFKDITENKRLSLKNKELVTDLQEKLSELNAIHNISEILQSKKKIKFLFPDIFEAILSAFDEKLHPVIKISLGNKIYKSQKILETEFKISSKFKIDSSKSGKLEVLFYPNNGLSLNEFEIKFKSKKILIRTIAENIEKFLVKKNAEAKLILANEKLKHSNEELEQFAYIASHDLQEPLRMVSSYLQLIERRYKDKIDDDMNDFINYAVDGAHRMKNLIQDLLSFSRVTTRANPYEKFNSGDLVSLVLKDLGILIEDKNAEIKYKNLPEIYADQNQIKMVIQNLIENGIKFNKRKPVIEIKCNETPKFWEFSISDNGIGIDMKYKEKIFKIFERLHNIGEYSGSGIGLAISKRIINRHNGKIWMDSNINEGTTFYFTIKKSVIK